MGAAHDDIMRDKNFAEQEYEWMSQAGEWFRKTVRHLQQICAVNR
jgi:hypothetical protein